MIPFGVLKNKNEKNIFREKGSLFYKKTMCGSEMDRPVGLTVVITAGVAFGFVIGSLALDYIRSPKKPKKCKKVHVKPYENSNDIYQQRPPQVQTSPQQWGQ